MFEDAEIGNAVGKAEYKKRVPKLRIDLLQAQHQLAASDFAMVVIIGGVEGAGKTEFATTLMTWLDMRGVEVHAWGEPTDEERDRPYFWKFWMGLPARRRSALLLSSWYSTPIVQRVFKQIGDPELDQHLDRILEFERMLVREKVLLVKLWFHLSKEGQRKRFKKLETDPDTRWRVTERDWQFHKKYDRFRSVSERSLMKTSTGEAPWQIIEGSDARYRNLTAGACILDALRARLRQAAAEKPHPPVPDLPKPKPRNILRRLDLTQRLDEETFVRRLEKLQGKIGLLTRALRERGKSLITVFEGADAAGKGGAIHRLAQSIDVRLFRVQSVAAPTDEERAHPYLWRFWRALPRLGRVTIYDRSWYGRVLVERIEGFAAPEEWSRAFAEINAFEEQLTGIGTILLKFWLTISPAEQLRRFKEREVTPYKQYKITEEDWRNRAKFDAYEAAACEMIERTGTERAPWVLVEAEDKLWARVKVLQTVADALERALA